MYSEGMGLSDIMPGAIRKQSQYITGEVSQDEIKLYKERVKNQLNQIDIPEEGEEEFEELA